MSDVDDLVATYILRKYREENAPDVFSPTGYDHLAACPEAAVTDPDAFSDEDESGREYVMFTATIRCPHGYATDWEYGQFGVLGHLLAELEAEAGRLASS